MTVEGSRRPKFAHFPPIQASLAGEARKLAELSDLTLDPWQFDILEAGMGRDETGAWSASELCLVAPRQNGKSEGFLARAHWGAAEGDDELILWTAHEFKTARESFMRLKGMVEHPAFVAEYGEATVSVSHGKEGITYPNGNRILFIARSRTSGRGFSPDLIILDEAFELDDLALAALKPALAAKKNPSMWFASSAPHDTSVVLRRLCHRGRNGEGSKLAYFEWAADLEASSSDVSAWLEANPAIGYRITLEAVTSELEMLDEDDFRRERLGIWSEEVFQSVIDRQLWEQAANLQPPKPSGARTLAIDVDPNRRRTVIAAAGDLSGRTLVQILEDRDGVSWVVDQVAALVAEHKPDAVLVDGAGQSQTLITPLEKAGVEVTRIGPSEMVAACGEFLDAVHEGRLVHMADPSLDAAVEGAKQRNLGDGWAWARRTSASNVSPLVAASLAVYGVAHHENPTEWTPFAWS